MPHLTPRLLLAVFTGFGMAGLAIAASAQEIGGDPIALRRAILANMGEANQIGGGMARGDTPYDAEKAMAVMRVLNNGIMGVVSYFPEGSDTGDTRALPLVWETHDDFMMRAENLRAASAAYLENPPTTADEFPAAYQNVVRNCGACHEDYRRPE